MKLFSKIEKNLDRIGIWAGGYTILTGFFSWIVKHLKYLQPYGWAEAVLGGFLFASLAVAVISAALVAWTKFRPRHLEAQSDETIRPNNSPSIPQIFMNDPDYDEIQIRLDTFGTTLEKIERGISATDARFHAIYSQRILDEIESKIEEVTSSFISVPSEKYSDDAWSQWIDKYSEWMQLLDHWIATASTYHPTVREEVKTTSPDDYSPKNWSSSESLFPNGAAHHEYKKARLTYFNYVNAKKVVGEEVLKAAFF